MITTQDAERIGYDEAKYGSMYSAMSTYEAKVIFSNPYLERAFNIGYNEAQSESYGQTAAGSAY